ncbi:MAG: sugar diacid recognition domain-containing protein [Mesobacillus sp.]|uniref:sugar diacid recognition domain-containing protein n=1 Tax=Mesobacillus sp. TaxID=2675271 RepID=UPI003C3EFCD6
MEFLNKQLAQEIVDRTMGIIGRNINVMDNRGIIIGSGDKNRIDNYHEGAVMVLDKGQGFAISEVEAKKLNGVKAGINLPITFEGTIVGVIGITGPPDEIINYGELVRMAAELSLQQAVLMNEIQWDERLREEVVSQILHFEGKFDSLFLERSKRLGIDLELPRSAMIILTPDRKKSFSFLKNRLEKEDLFLMQHDRIVILKKIPSGETTNVLSYLKKIAEGWHNGMKEYLKMDVKIAIGDYHDGLTGTAKSYLQASNTLIAGLKLEVERHIFTYKDYYLPVFLLVASREGLTEDLEPLIALLSRKDPKGELTETLRVYIETNGDMNGTAHQLYIHRNTLRYRLDKITEITGKDPRKTTELLHLYIALLNHVMK